MMMVWQGGWLKMFVYTKFSKLNGVKFLVKNSSMLYNEHKIAQPIAQRLRCIRFKEGA